MNDTPSPTPPQQTPPTQASTDPPASAADQPFWQAPIPQDVETDKDAKLYGMLCHLLALAGLVTGGLGSIVGPLIIWLIKREQFPFVDDQGKESVNFQLTILIACFGLMLITLVTCGVAGIITVPVMIALGIVDIVFSVIAGLKANEGIRYRYPLNWRIIK